MKILLIFCLITSIAYADDKSLFMSSCIGTLKFDSKLNNNERSKILQKAMSDCEVMYSKKTNPNIQLAEKKLELKNLKLKMNEVKKHKKKKVKKIK